MNPHIADLFFPWFINKYKSGELTEEMTAVSSQTDWISVFTVTALLIAIIIGAVITARDGKKAA